MVVNVDALSSTLSVGTPITSNYAWDFGDPGSTDDQMTGFNAAHVYDQAGTYTIKLTVTDSNGKSATVAQQVTIAASARNQIFVDPSDGSDSNSGSENSPLKSLAAAFNKLNNNTEILLCAGQTFSINESMHINYSNVLIGRYGTGANPIISRSSGNGVSCIASYASTNGLTIQDITFTSPYYSTASNAPKIGVSGIYLGGQNCTVRDCSFLNLDDGINENGNPVGVLIQGNSAPQTVGLRGYMVWGQGAEQVIIDNYAAGTTQEHIVRLVGVNEVTVEGNNFTNHDGKGCIEMHKGSYAWIQGNTVTGGDIRLGPLGLWGESPSSSTDSCVIEDNQLTDTFIYLQAGTHNAMISNNIINNTAGQAIEVAGPDSQGRTSENITIINNTATDSGTQGNFIAVWGYVDGIVMQKNLWIAPQEKISLYGTSPVLVNGNYMSSFTLISDNVWGEPAAGVTGGINYANGYLTAAQWDALPNVKGDVFESLPLDGSYQMTIDSLLVGASIRAAA
jgi:PKD repeat protein